MKRWDGSNASLAVEQEGSGGWGTSFLRYSPHGAAAVRYIVSVDCNKWTPSRCVLQDPKKRMVAIFYDNRAYGTFNLATQQFLNKQGALVESYP